MKIAICKLKSNSAYSQNRYHDTEKLNKELDNDYEQRTWRERCNVNEDGNIIIPPMAFANCIKEAAKYLNISIKGGGKRTYTKHFEAGVLVAEPLVLSTKKDDVVPEWVFVPTDGRRGSGRRVMKCFPTILNWEGEVTFYILDDIITEDVFKQVLNASGELIGVGRFRPRNLGYYGRFKVEDIKWKEK